MAGIEYFKLVILAQTPVEPVISPLITGVGGLMLIAMERSVPVPQSLVALTVIFPEPELPAVISREGVVVVKLVAENPFGNVQIYCVSPVTTGTVYVPLVPGHKVAGPEVNVPGC